MVIPNECVRQQYWRFMINIYEDWCPQPIKPDQDAYREMVYNGVWEPVISNIGKAFLELSSVRDSIGGEHNVQGFFKAWLGVCDYSILCPEMELNYGFSDFVMLPLRNHHPQAKHCYIFEIKYVKQDAPAEEANAKYVEAEAQIKQYSASPRLLKAIHGCTLHGITVLFRGPHMEPPHPILKFEV